jgi:hypothetical protein
MAPRFKLRLELVPERLWGINLRSNKVGIGQGRWKKVRLRAIEACGGKCVNCGATEKLHGHEVWKYDEKRTVGRATLVKVDAVCRTCHGVSHWGLTTILVADGRMQYETFLLLKRHFRKVNRCLQSDFDRHIKRSFAQHQRRSEKKWKVDWGSYAPLIAEAKAARALWRERNVQRLSSSATRDFIPQQTVADEHLGHPDRFASLERDLKWRQVGSDGFVKRGRPKKDGEGASPVQRHRARKRVLARDGLNSRTT